MSFLGVAAKWLSAWVSDNAIRQAQQEAEHERLRSSAFQDAYDSMLDEVLVHEKALATLGNNYAKLENLNAALERELSKYENVSEVQARRIIDRSIERDRVTGLIRQDIFEESIQSTTLDTWRPALWIDIDNFKVVNDRLGRHIGNLVLNRAGALYRTAAELEGIDPTECFRPSGDEANIYIDGEPDSEEGYRCASQRAERITRIIREQFPQIIEKACPGQPVDVAIGFGRNYLFAMEAAKADKLSRGVSRTIDGVRPDWEAEHAAE